MEETYEGVMTTSPFPQRPQCATMTVRTGHHRSFLSDIGYNPFKQTMLLLAAFFLLVAAGRW